MESLAYNIQSNGLIASMIDAKNDNVYFALFEHNNNSYTIKEDYIANNINSVLDLLQKYKENEITFVGDGSILHKEEIIKNLNLQILLMTIKICKLVLVLDLQHLINSNVDLLKILILSHLYI